jgi:two-component system, NarL family, nitrate/nitrite response regulator NarL
MAPATGRTATVLLVDDHAMFREALRKLFENDADLLVVGEAADGEQALRMAAELRPDIVLLDLRMPGTSGLQVLRALGRLTPAIRTLVLTAEVGESDVVEALQLGARGVVMKHAAPEILFESIRAVMAGQYWVGQECVADLVAKVREGRPRGTAPIGTRVLTLRERQIMSEVASGCTNAEIAAKFAISAKTVKHHLTNVFDKLGVSNRLELALFAVHRRFDGDRLFEQ